MRIKPHLLLTLNAPKLKKCFLQVACVFTQTSATSLTVIAPPSVTIALPGIYQLFVVCTFSATFFTFSDLTELCQSHRVPVAVQSFIGGVQESNNHKMSQQAENTCACLQVSNTGRPSMAYNLGLGGAVPEAAYTPPATTPVLANGVYTIASNGRAACTNLLSAVNCNVDNTIQMANTG
jgi:hypothetical protein